MLNWGHIFQIIYILMLGPSSFVLVWIKSEKSEMVSYKLFENASKI